MQIHASTKSRAWKRGAEKRIATLLNLPSPPGLHSMCSSLHLDAMNGADVALLTAMYVHVFSLIDKSGEVVVLDKTGKEVIRYSYAKDSHENSH